MDLPSWLGLVVSGCWLLVSGLLATPAQAQVLYATESATINATIPSTEDNTEPPDPFALISPDNNEVVTVSRPTFIWEEATDDNHGIDKYVFSLDGQILFDDVPTDDFENDDFKLEYDADNDRYSLTPKFNLSDGPHTWKVRAVNTSNIGTDSATWNFTIDTQAPPFVVTAIGEVATSISAQDISTVPTEPIELAANSPLIVANGEANAQVTMTVVILGDPTQEYTSDVSGAGTWGQQLGILPRDVILLVSFLVIDQANQVSTITNIPVIIPGEVITIPPATPGPGGELPEPILELSIIPGAEIIQEIIQESTETIEEQFGPVLQPIVDVTVSAGTGFVEVGRAGLAETLPLLPLLLTVATPVAATMSTTGGVSFKLLIRMLQSLGLIPAGKPQGIVFDSDTHQPVAFALLTIRLATTGGKRPGTESAAANVPPENTIQETVVTDVNGIYSGVKLEPNSYVIDVQHQEFTFPTTQTRPPYLSLREFYQGEDFEVSSKKVDQLFLIPVDKVDPNQPKSWLSRLKIAFLRFNSKMDALIYPLLFFSALVLLYSPTIWNWLVFGVYVALVLSKAVNWFKVPALTGFVVDQLGQPIENVVIRLSRPETNDLVSLVTTNAKGVFEAFVEPDLYQISVTKPGFIWEGSSSLGMNQIDVRAGTQAMAISLQSAASSFDDWLNQKV